MIFAQPGWLILAAPIVVWWLWQFGLLSFGAKRHTPYLAVPAGAAVRLHTRMGMSRHLPTILMGVAALCWTVALAQPQRAQLLVLEEATGTDVVLVLDVSESMLARDVAPNRLEAAKQVAGKVIRGLNGHRVALVVAAQAAYQVIPLTLDRSFAQRALATLSTGTLPKEGSALSDALVVSAEILREAHGRQHGLIVVLSDGAHNTGLLGPLTAGQLVAKQGVPVASISFGDTVAGASGALASTLSTLPTLETTAPDILAAWAQVSQGINVRADEPGGLAAVFALVDAQEARSLGTRTTRELVSHHELWVWLGTLAWLLVGVCWALGLRNPLQ